ncbi:unnamed protein product [Symbiodinium sp. CCMP2592]|nr:unnamed protein product [Symbiodinium sp. CCMP2592]
MALQLIPTPGRRDHKPGQVEFQHVLAYGESQAHRFVWGRDSMVRCLFYGEERKQFLQAVETACSDERWATVDGTEQTWQVFNEAIQDVSKRFFTKASHTAKRHPQDTEAAFSNMPAARHQLVSQPDRRVCIHDPMHQDLQLLLHRWKLVPTFRRTRREHDELCKRDRQVAERSLLGEFNHYWRTGHMANVWSGAPLGASPAKHWGPNGGDMMYLYENSPARKHGRHFSHWMEQIVDAAPCGNMASRNLLGVTLRDTKEENPSLKQVFSNMWWDIAFDSISARTTNAFDVANAFYSLYHDCPHEAMSTCVHDDDIGLVKQRYRDKAVCVEARDGRVCVRPQTGALQGDTCASDILLEVYHPRIDWWNDRSPQILVKDPVTRHVVDVSLSTYAGDVSKTIMCTDAADLGTQVDVFNFHLDVSLERAGMAQNKEKQEHVPCFCGQGTQQQYKNILQDQTLPGSSKRSAKYLGGQQHHLDTCEDEIQQRERASSR